MTTLDWMLSRVDTLILWLIPPSLIGAFFGDSLRKDVLTLRQRASVFIAMAFAGVLVGGSVAREFKLLAPEYTAGAVALAVATLGTDIVGLVASFIRYMRDNPDKVREFLTSFTPWGKK